MSWITSYPCVKLQKEFVKDYDTNFSAGCYESQPALQLIPQTRILFGRRCLLQKGPYTN